MGGQQIAFFAANGVTLLLIAALIVLLIKKFQDVLLEAMFGAVLCFIAQYILYPFAFNAFMGWIDGFYGLVSEAFIHTLIEIAFSVLFEILCFILVMILFRKRVTYRAALAVGAGYWLFMAILGLAINVFDAITSISLVFTGSELEVFATGIQTALELPFFCCLAVLAGRVVAEKRMKSLLLAIIIDLVWRLLLALPLLTGLAMMIALGMMLLAALMVIVFILRNGRDMEARRAEMEAEELAIEAEAALLDETMESGADEAAADEDADEADDDDEADEDADEAADDDDDEEDDDAADDDEADADETDAEEKLAATTAAAPEEIEPAENEEEPEAPAKAIQKQIEE